MNLDVLCAFVYSWLLGSVIYLIYAVSRLQSKLHDLADEVNELKKEIKNDKRKSNRENNVFTR